MARAYSLNLRERVVAADNLPWEAFDGHLGVPVPHGFTIP
jgi:hypothetical protein